VCLDDLVFTNPASRFRVVSIAEGCSFLILLVFGSLLSRISHIDLVMPLGLLHGVLFVALVVATLDMRVRLDWGAKITVLALVAAILPFGPFVFAYAKRTELSTAERALAAQA
jgi:integral membrane protein